MKETEAILIPLTHMYKKAHCPGLIVINHTAKNTTVAKWIQILIGNRRNRQNPFGNMTFLNKFLFM